MKREIFIAGMIALLLASPALAYETINSAVCENGMCYPPQQNMNQRPNPAVVRIAVQHENTKSYGTGTFVRDDVNHYFIMTCAHLFENSSPRKITVIFPDQSAFEVRLLAIDRTWDLAILWDEVFLQSEKTLTAIPIGKTPPKAGDILHYAGYGSTGQYIVQKGRVEGYCTVQNGGTSETLVITGSARQGDSGGPIVNTNGELVGVLWGTDGRTICGTYCGRIERFIQFFQPFKNIKEYAGEKAAEAAKEQITESVVDVKKQIDEKIDGVKQAIIDETKPVIAGIQKVVSAVVVMVYTIIATICITALVFLTRFYKNGQH
jgi:S1-C subfamily serine protease